MPKTIKDDTGISDLEVPTNSKDASGISDLEDAPQILNQQQQVLKKAGATQQFNTGSPILDQALGLTNRFATGFNAQFDPRNIVQPIIHPLDTATSIGQQLANVRQQASQMPSNNILDIASKGIKTAEGYVPVLGPFLSQMSDSIDKGINKGDWGDLAEISGSGVGSALMPTAYKNILIKGGPPALKAAMNTIGKKGLTKLQDAKDIESYNQALQASQQSQAVGYQEALDRINKYQSPNVGSDLSQMLQDESSIKTWKPVMGEQKMEDLAMRKIFTDHTDFATGKVNPDTALNDLNKNPMWEKAMTPQGKTNLDSFFRNLKESQTQPDAPPVMIKDTKGVWSPLRYYGTKLGVGLATSALGGYVSHSLAGAVLGGSGYATLKLGQYGMSKFIQSNPELALRLSKPGAVIDATTTKAILNTLRGVSGLSLADQNNNETPISVNEKGQIVSQ